MHTIKFYTAAIFLLLFLSAGCRKTEPDNSSTANDSLQTAYRQEIDSWHKNRIKSLTKDHGWLSLVLLQWLKEGENQIEGVGRVALKKGVVSLDMDKGISARSGDHEFSNGILKTDQDKEGPTKVVIGSRALIIIKRGEKFAIRMWDSEAPGRKKFSGIARYPVSPEFKINARWEQYPVPKKILVPSVIPGLSDTSAVHGAAVFSLVGSEYRLEPIVEPPDSICFFIFADASNGNGTYHAGRFLYSYPPRNGMITLDFNKAFNPPCAFTEFATCPLPPAQNRLKVKIEAGEKYH